MQTGQLFTVINVNEKYFLQLSFTKAYCFESGRNSNNNNKMIIINKGNAMYPAVVLCLSLQSVSPCT